MLDKLMDTILKGIAALNMFFKPLFRFAVMTKIYQLHEKKNGVILFAYCSWQFSIIELPSSVLGMQKESNTYIYSTCHYLSFCSSNEENNKRQHSFRYRRSASNACARRSIFVSWMFHPGTDTIKQLYKFTCAEKVLSESIPKMMDTLERQMFVLPSIPISSDTDLQTYTPAVA